MFRTKHSKRETKSGISAETGRQKRLGQSNTLRRNDREELLSQRRRDNTTATEDPTVIPSADAEEVIKDIPHVPQLVENLDSDDRNVLNDSIFRLRQLVSLHQNPPFDQVIDCGGLPRLVRLLNTDDTHIAFEAAWCLTNIASGTPIQTAAVVNSGPIPRLVTLLDSTDIKLRDQCVWALGNIAGEHPKYRDMILNLGALDKLIEISGQVLRLCMLRNVSWAISNLCRGRNPPADFRVVSRALIVLSNMLNFNDEEVIIDAAWSISFLSDDSHTSGEADHQDIDRIQAVIDTGVSLRLVQLLTHNNINIKTPVLRTIGNLVSGSHAQTQVVLNNNVLPSLLALVNSNRRAIRREAAWAISNIAAGTSSQLRYLRDFNVFGILLNVIQQPQSTIHIKTEICWAIANAVCHRDVEITPHILELGWIKVLIPYLREQEDELQSCVLDILQYMLEFGQSYLQNIEIMGTCRDVNIYALAIEEADGIQALEHTLSSQNYENYLRALELLTKYLGLERDDRPEDDQGQFIGHDSNSNEQFVTANPFQSATEFSFNNNPELTQNDHQFDF